MKEAFQTQMGDGLTSKQLVETLNEFQTFRMNLLEKNRNYLKSSLFWYHRNVYANLVKQIQTLEAEN